MEISNEIDIILNFLHEYKYKNQDGFIKHNEYWKYTKFPNNVYKKLRKADLVVLWICDNRNLLSNFDTNQQQLQELFKVMPQDIYDNLLYYLNDILANQELYISYIYIKKEDFVKLRIILIKIEIIIQNHKMLYIK
jgi:hypothetical protein